MPRTKFQHGANQQGREALVENPNCRFIGVSEYCALITSNKPFERCDDSSLAIRGVRDLSTGVRFLIGEDELSGAIY